MNITKWGKEFDEQFNHDEPNGRALVLIISNPDGSKTQIPAQDRYCNVSKGNKLDVRNPKTIPLLKRLIDSLENI